MPKAVKLITCLMLLTACGEQDSVTGAQTDSAAGLLDGRWYSTDQVATGAAIFAANCATCHGELAQGLAADWQARLPDGSYPPPPLNGSAHAWHHPLAQLLQVIETGGIPYGGNMPPFAGQLDRDAMLAAVAFFQSQWSEEIYQNWVDLGGLN
jgi:mono/diheme cytochrome c family protein